MSCNKWTTKDGGKIRIKDMTDEHLLNATHLLSRRYNQMVKNLYAFAGMIHGEQASVCVEDEIDREESEGSIEEHFPIYADMMDELERRQEKQPEPKESK